MNTVKGTDILELKNQIVDNFTLEDWLELGYLLDCKAVIEGHRRLLRSLQWGDDDYGGMVLDVLDDIIRKNDKNFQAMKVFLSRKYPPTSDFISTAHTEVPKKVISFSPQVFSVPDKAQNDLLVAVMLPFSFSETFTAISRSCTKQGLVCKKADDIWENSTFIQDIFELIFTCKVVVADFTGKNPNVFYEIGIAHTLGKTVIPITQSIADVPSDLVHHRALKYLPNAQGYIDLSNELGKRLGSLFSNKAVEW